ncbi:unnamed protein product, partial [Mesorhabditis spiculigera]
MEVIANQPVVIDNGSGGIKAGFAGESAPKVAFANYVGRPKYKRVMAGALEGDIFIGPKAKDNRGLLSLRYPMEHGIVTDWNDMEKVWQYIYSKEQLNVFPEEHPVLLTEAPLNPSKHREKAAEIFFETFNAPALHIQMQAVLALYASGRTTGVIVDSGDGVTHIVPIYEGFAVHHGIERMDVAGRDVTRFLRMLLQKEGHNLHTSPEFEIVREIKEKVCYVAANSSKEEQNEGDKEVKCQLPDGSWMDMRASRFRAPEVLFRPDIIGEEWPGVAVCIDNAIRKCDMDLRKTLYANIVLSGGSTMFQGFGTRLLADMQKLAPTDTKVKISAPQERIHSTWIGGSILASLDTFRRMWVSKSEYEDEGKKIIHKKFF